VVEVPVSSRVLEETAERCIRLAYRCQNKNVERFFRLLAVDLMLAAQQRATSAPATLADEFAELGRLSRQAANDAGIRRGSASTA
jgi:hypothetical protein